MTPEPMTYQNVRLLTYVVLGAVAFQVAVALLR